MVHGFGHTTLGGMGLGNKTFEAYDFGEYPICEIRVSEIKHLEDMSLGNATFRVYDFWRKDIWHIQFWKI